MERVRRTSVKSVENVRKSTICRFYIDVIYYMWYNFFAFNKRTIQDREVRKAIMKIIKRSGTEEDFNISKIEKAILKANNSVVESEKLSEEQMQEISEHVEEVCSSMNRALNVEEIQDLVENEIMQQQAFTVARNYITYRYERALVRKANSTDCLLYTSRCV